MQPAECCICSSLHAVGPHYGIMACKGCRHFISMITQKNGEYHCRAGSFACDIRHWTAADGHRCPGCRLRQALDMGLKHPLFDTDYVPKSTSEHQDLSNERTRPAGALSSQDFATSPPSLPLITAELIQHSQYHRTSSSGAPITRDQTVHLRAPKRNTKCSICGRKAMAHRTYNLDLCPSCCGFLDRCVAQRRFRFTCHSGKKRCDVTFSTPYQRFCRACRFGKAVAMGFKPPSFSDHYVNLDQPSSLGDAPQLSTSNTIPFNEKTRPRILPACTDYPTRMTSNDNCSICKNPRDVRYLPALKWNCCNFCWNFLKTTLDLNLTYICYESGDCSVEPWAPDIFRDSLGPCKSCWWRRIINATNLGRKDSAKKTPSHIEASSSSIPCCTEDRSSSLGLDLRSIGKDQPAGCDQVPSVRSSSNIIVSQEFTTTSGMVTTRSPSGLNDCHGTRMDNELTCSVCERPDHVALKNFRGICVCQDCSRFIKITLDESRSYECQYGAECSTKWNPFRSQSCDACRWTKVKLMQQFQHEQDGPKAGPSSSAVAHVVEARENSAADVEGQSGNRQLGESSRETRNSDLGSSPGRTQALSSPKEGSDQHQEEVRKLDEYTVGYTFNCGFCNNYTWKMRLASSFAFCGNCHDWNRTSVSLIGPGEDCDGGDNGAIIDIRHLKAPARSQLQIQ